MSKISRELLKDTIAEMLKASEDKKRNFTETVELQICLKNYDPSKDKRFSGTVKLPAAPKPKFSVCVLGDAAHIEEAEKNGVAFMDIEALKALKKSKKLVRKLAKQYDAFLASDTLIKQIPRLLGPGLNKAGKFPTLLTHSDNMMEKINDLSCTIKFQMKKVLCLGVAVGSVSLTVEELEKNIVMSVNFLVSLLKKNWQNVKSLVIKTTMGKPHRIY
mmetsp:Transcript_14773/g.20968  ORF Transcript_14773/g.20968 Transcript_14773/m.20968 type:complete len:217 (-) Transcript_14773:320-970(-)